MRLQGWYRDPYGNHDDRWFSDGQPTNLVRDQGVESHDELPGHWRPPDPRGRPPGDRRQLGQTHGIWRWWTVCLPALLTLGVSGGFILYAALDSAGNCSGGCRPASQGMPVGLFGEIAVAISTVVLVFVGLRTPDWRRSIAVALWVTVAFASGCAVLIATARPAAPDATGAPLVSAGASPSLDAAACTTLGGRVISAYHVCFAVPYVSNGGQRGYGEVNYGPGGQLTGPALTVGAGATRAECDSGRYPNGPSGPVTRPPGRWDAQLSLCLP
jgi:hypothetical protein